MYSNQTFIVNSYLKVCNFFENYTSPLKAIFSPKGALCWKMRKSASHHLLPKNARRPEEKFPIATGLDFLKMTLLLQQQKC